MKKIGFIGIGKLGLDCAEVMTEKHEVRGYDIYPRTSDSVKVCDIDELVNESEWIFIAVPTPHAEGYDGSVPSSHMEPRDFGHDAVLDAIRKINTHARSPKKVVLISTVLPGTTRRKFITLLDPQHQFLYNPYLIAMGSVKWDMVNPEMIIIGTEDGKGNALITETNEQLRRIGDIINYVGPIEGFQVFTDHVDVVVCDGFVGNIMLKSWESLVKFFSGMLREELQANPLRAAGAVLAKGAFTALKERINPERYGGAPLLGLKGNILKAHGSSNARAISSAIHAARAIIKADMNQYIEADIARANEILCGPPSAPTL